MTLAHPEGIDLMAQPDGNVPVARTEGSAPASEERATSWTWSRLVWLAPVSLGATFLLVMLAVLRTVDPFFLVIIAILFVTGFVGRRFPRRAGPITVLVVMLLLLAMNSASLFEDLAHPESAFNFVAFGIVPVTLVVVGALASIVALTGRGNRGASAVAYGSVAIIAIAGVVGVAAAVSLEDDTAAAGDVQIVAEKVEFTPDALSSAGNSVGVFVENKDPIRHTFAIEALDIEIELPASTARRVDVSGPPGSYEFICTVPGHEDMKGTVTLTG